MSENGFLEKPKGFSTKAIHIGHDPDNWNIGCVIPPIVNSTTYKQDAPDEDRGYDYSRTGNPTRNVLETCLASLDNGKYGLTFSSGLGAATCITSLLSQGDHLISIDDVYGGTNNLFRSVISKMGIETTFVDLLNISNLESAITPKTKMLWVESPTNPTMKVVDIKEIKTVLKKYPQIIYVVDNTFLTPYFQRPLELGVDIVMYSLSKFMNGHSDVIMGAAITNDEELNRRLKFLQNAQGIVPSPFDCYLVNRGLKTLALRMEQHMKSGLAVAKYLQSHPMVIKVLHPCLPSHPQVKISKKQCSGHSGVFSFYIKGDVRQSNKFLQSLKIFTLAGSLGGDSSLASLPVIMSHSSVPVEQRVKLGLTDNLIRLSVGLEDANDLIDDLDQALFAASMI